jgi:hypothetical protein
MTYSCASFLSLNFELSGKGYVLPRYGSNVITSAVVKRVPVLQVTEKK